MRKRWITVLSLISFTAAVAYFMRGRRPTLRVQMVLVAGGNLLSYGELYSTLFGTFSGTSRMNQPRVYPAATRMSDGRVLVTGGDAGAVVSNAEVYDPNVDLFTPTRLPMMSARQFHTSTLLPGGNVLIAGGEDDNQSVLNSAELYDPNADTFAATGSMGAARKNHTATRLYDGWTLIAGGEDGTGNALISAELYDLANRIFYAPGVFTPVQMTQPRTQHTATNLSSVEPGGRILLAGGLDGNHVLDSAEVYERFGGWPYDTFTATNASMTSPRVGHTATRLSDGNILIAGGLDGASGALNTAEIFDLSNGFYSAMFRRTRGDMMSSRWLHTATLLDDGRVLLAGGNDDANPAHSAELYDPVSETFTSTGPMTVSRSGHVAVSLSGRPQP